MATMYDACLDHFVKQKWAKSFFPEYGSYISWNGVGFNRAKKYYFIERGNQAFYAHSQSFVPTFNWFGFYMPYAGGRRYAEYATADAVMMKSNVRTQEVAEDFEKLETSGSPGLQNENVVEVTEDTSPIEPFSYRENLNETVFFYPELKSADGELRLKFKMNEALTKWNYLVLAHTKDLSYVFDMKSVLTQKPLMVEPHLPRFFREDDEITINAKVSNLSENDLNTEVEISLFDYIDESEVSQYFLIEPGKKELVLNAGESKNVEWVVKIPEDFKSALNVKIKALGGEYSDGEANVIPVLSNRILVTESLPMHVESNVQKVFEFEALQKMERSETLKNHLFSIEFTNDPSWLVLKSIPYLLDNPHNSSISLINTFYGTSLAHDMIKGNAAFAKAISLWDMNGDRESSFTKNADLKLSQLEETPWVREAKSEEENMRKLKVLLDDNYVEQQLETVFSKLKNRQQSNGGFSWPSRWKG